MRDEQKNQIERREEPGGIGRRSDLARRGMRAFDYVSGLSLRQDAGLQPISPTSDVSFEFLRKWGTEGNGDGQFYWPSELAIDMAGNVYVADRDNYRIQVFDLQGRFLYKWGTEGSGDGQFDELVGLAIDMEGNVYVADNHAIQVFRRVALDDA